MADDWRIAEILKLLRQCVVCPYCGSLVATEAGIKTHITWHDNMNSYVANVDGSLAQFSSYIIHPVTGIQKQIQDRLDTITNYVISPGTGLEARFTAELADLRSDATEAITALSTRVTTIETEITRPATGILARLSLLEL